MTSGIDHLVLAGGDLASLIEWFTDRSGVAPTPGGPHPGAGTRNALVALGPSVYLELIGPDPDQPRPQALRPFGIDGLASDERKLATFAYAVDDIEDAVNRLLTTEAMPGTVESMKRTRPDGVELSWKLAVPREDRQQGIVPFLIEWGDQTPHPSETSAPGCTLTQLSLQHPEPDFVAAALAAIGLETGEGSTVELSSGYPAVLSAEIETPAGSLHL